MPLFKVLDDRMTINIQSDKKKFLSQMAAEKHMSLSKFVLEKIVDDWLKNKREQENGRAD